MKETEMTPEQRREKRIQWKMAYCQHYDPAGVTMIGGKEPHGHCRAGVNYLDQFGRAPKDEEWSKLDGRYYESAGIFKRICCTSGNERTEAEQLASCPKWERCTREQGEKRADDLDAAMKRMTLVGPTVAAWRKKPPKGKQEIIDCPTGCGGKLHLSQSSYNGHVHGHCTTDGCVSWME
jgi:hypothetical protein